MKKSFIIKYKDEELKAHSLRADEIDKISDFLSTVSFSKENYRSLLGLDGEAVFRKKGGLIETSRELLVDVVENPDKYISVGIWNADGEPEAFIVCEAKDNENMLSSKDDFIFNEGYDDVWETWIKHKENYTIAYKGDMAVNTKSRFRKLYFIMFYMLTNDLLERGITKGISEVFHITGFFDGECWKDMDLYNERSFKAQIRGTKAKYAAYGKTKEKNLFDNLKLRYYAKYLEYDIKITHENTKSAISSLNLTFIEE